MPAFRACVLGCSPSARLPFGLIAVDTLDRMRRADCASFGSGRLDPVKYFPMPKVISGVGKDAVAIVGTQRLPLQAPDGRPVTITAGVMTNGNTGVADLLCGNGSHSESSGGAGDDIQRTI